MSTKSIFIKAASIKMGRKYRAWKKISKKIRTINKYLEKIDSFMFFQAETLSISEQEIA
jgi:hypothetical protein